MNPVVVLPLYGKGGRIVATTQIDAADEPWLGRYRWRYHKSGYAVRSTTFAGGRRELIPMHRAILGLRVGDLLWGDHINRNRLDNRRANLRTITPSGNAQNRNCPHGSSRHRGVTWHRGCRKWQASVVVGGRKHYLGLFVDENEAGAVAAAFRAEHMPYADPERAAA